MNKRYESHFQNNQKEIIFILSVDTEEEWDWTGPFPERNFSVKNTLRIPKFQDFCNKLGIRPTYFIDYAVADDSASVEILKSINDSKQCEIAGHLHPWCTPPFDGSKTSAENSHVVNLDINVVEEKIQTLNEKIRSQFGSVPRSFRTGRWGINGEVIRLIAKQQYTVDSSVYPYYSNQHISCEGAEPKPYWPDFNDPLTIGSQRDLIELPITAGFNRKHFRFWNRLHQTISSAPLKYFRLVGLFWHFKLLRKLYLSPELTSEADLIDLTRTALASNHEFIHMYLHSPSLLPSEHGFVKNAHEEELFYQKISAVVDHLKQQGPVRFCTIKEAADIYRQRYRPQQELE